MYKNWWPKQAKKDRVPWFKKNLDIFFVCSAHSSGACQDKTLILFNSKNISKEAQLYQLKQ
jgi:hypothetical protein